ncbi:MAG: hypothetical protein GKR91_09525 [Pseudomonadales bacterium]|nr:hypothetical protein [Pseudomonadales bacterium]
MRLFLASLILIVIFSVSAVGWGVTQLYLAVDMSGDESSELVGFEILGRNIANTIDALSNSNQFVEVWNQHSDIMLEVHSRSEYQVPDDIVSPFLNGDPLILETVDSLSFNFYLESSGEVLSILAPSNLQPQLQDVQSLLLTIAFYVGVILIVAIWMYPLVLRLMKLRETTTQFGDGELTARVSTSRISYIAEIEHEFNRMADRINALIEDNKLLSRAVSHNLKTPLSRLRFGIDALEESEIGDYRKEQFSRLNNDLSEMESLIDTLLEYAKLEESGLAIDLEPVDLSMIISEILNLNSQDSLSVCVETTDEKVMVWADRNFVSMQLTNVIDNAITHSDSKIKVSVTENQNVFCTIEDDGSGFIDQDIELAALPFWRADSVKKSNGHGMGLAISKKISEWFGGEMRISRSKSLGGASVTLIYRTVTK